MKLDKISNDLELEIAKIIYLYLRNEKKDLINYYLTDLKTPTPQIEDYISMLDNAISDYNSSNPPF